MPPNRLVEYLAEVAAAFQGLKDCHIEKYEEEILTPERANLRIRVRFAAGQLLEYNEAVTTHSNNLGHLSYRYHFQAVNNELVFRYDNTPHFPALENFPAHKHLPDRVISAVRPLIKDLLEEIDQCLSKDEPNTQ